MERSSPVLVYTYILYSIYILFIFYFVTAYTCILYTYTQYTHITYDNSILLYIKNNKDSSYINHNQYKIEKTYENNI